MKICRQYRQDGSIQISILRILMKAWYGLLSDAIHNRSCQWVLFWTVFLMHFESEQDMNVLVGSKKERLDIKVALSNSFGFGGHNSSILFAPYTSWICLIRFQTLNCNCLLYIIPVRKIIQMYEYTFKRKHSFLVLYAPWFELYILQNLSNYLTLKKKKKFDLFQETPASSAAIIKLKYKSE